MPSRTPREDGLLQEVQGLCQSAPTLRHACRALLDLVASKLGVDRAVMLVHDGEELDGVGSGVSTETLEQLLGAVRTAEPERLPSRGAFRRLGRTVPSELEEFQIFPVESTDGTFAAALLVDGDGLDSELSILPGAFERTLPAFSRLAEVDRLRRQLEEAQDEVTHLRSAFDSLPDPVVVLGERSRLFLTNRRAEQLLISSPGDSRGRRRAVETNNLFFSAFRTKSLLGESESREILLVDPEDGSDLLFEVNVLRVASELSAGTGYIYVLRDITDLKRTATELESQYQRSLAAEHRVRRESERLNVVLANAGVPILVTDEWSDIVLMNHDAERLFETTQPASSAGSERAHDIRSNDATLTGLISDFLLQPQERREEELTLLAPDRVEELPFRAVLTKITNRRGEPTAVVCVLHDLTEEMEVVRLADQLRMLNAELEARVEEATMELSRRNRELEIQREELARASRLKTEFLAMMSHELRTPINSILGHNSLLREGILGELTSAQNEALEKMRASSDHLLSLINDILDLSKVEAGKLSLRPDSFSVRPFLEKLSDTIRPMAEKKGLSFELVAEPDVPPVYADPTRLRQVLLNLTSNALKFTSDGRIVVRAGMGRVPGRIRFEVEDTGVGIEDQDLEAIFEEFRQADQFTTREHRGTGLGLAISRKIITMMGGSLSVHSKPGEGSRFWFELPAADRAASSSPEPDVAQRAEPAPGSVFE